ncbi:hypothetical protein Tco_1441140 [Tanacetum coccineum]
MMKLKEFQKSKKADTVYNDAFEVTQELSKRIVELEKDLSKFEAKSISFEIALQHNFQENISLKTLQKENENFLASLQIENAHLKQTYKDLSDSVQRSRVQTNHSDEVKVKDNFDEIETKNIELEHRVASLIKKNEHLKLTYKIKFDSLNRKRRETNVSKSSKPSESVSAKVHTGESSKPFPRRVSQFTNYSLQKDKKFSKKYQSFETLFPHKGFKTRASNVKNQFFKTSHSRFTPVKQAWRPKQSHSKSFKYSKSEMLSMQNKNDSASIINKKGRFSNEAKTNFQNVSSNDNHKWKSSSSTRFKTPHETPSFKNQWKIKRNFKSLLIPRALFSNETPVSSSHWNSTSLHRIDTTFN